MVVIYYSPFNSDAKKLSEVRKCRLAELTPAFKLPAGVRSIPFVGKWSGNKPKENTFRSQVNLHDREPEITQQFLVRPA